MFIEYKILTTGILYIIPYFIYFKNKLGVIPLCNIELRYLEKICNFCPFNFKNYFPPYLSGEMIGIKLKKKKNHLSIITSDHLTHLNSRFLISMLMISSKFSMASLKYSQSSQKFSRCIPAVSERKSLKPSILFCYKKIRIIELFPLLQVSLICTHTGPFSTI